MARFATAFAFGIWLALCCCADAQITTTSASSGDGPVAPHVSESALLPAFTLPFSIVAADFNGDGALDLAVAVTFVNGAPPHPGFAAVILQNPLAPGKFLRAVHYATGTDPVAIATADLNGDGLPDLVVANNTSANISILLQDPANPGQFIHAKNRFTGGNPSGVAIGDLNGDGLPDIAVATGLNGVSILIQDPAGPSGTFLPPARVPVRGGSTAVAIGDLNGDGMADLAITAARIAVRLQDPHSPGSFLPERDFIAGLQPLAIKIADLNGDGLPDLAVANLGSPTKPFTASASVLRQNPAQAGSFLKRLNYGTGPRSQGVAVGDLNGDGRMDLVVANGGTLSNHGSVSVLLQKPLVSFKPAFSRINYARKSGPLGVAIGDLNRDGKPDIAVADGNAATIMFQNPTKPGKFFASVAVGG